MRSARGRRTWGHVRSPIRCQRVVEPRCVGKRTQGRADIFTRDRVGSRRHLPEQRLARAGRRRVWPAGGESRRAPRTASHRETRWQTPSAAVWNPAGESAVAERTAPWRARSSEIQPPSELPATCGRSSPVSRRNSDDQPRSDSIPRRGPGGRHRRGGEAREVDRDDVSLAGEPVQHGLPHLPAAADAMDQHERRAGTRAVVVEVHDANLWQRGGQRLRSALDKVDN